MRNSALSGPSWPATVGQQKMVNGLVRANTFITSSSGEGLARLVPQEIRGDPKGYAESFSTASPGSSDDAHLGVVPAGMKLEPEALGR